MWRKVRLAADVYLPNSGREPIVTMGEVEGRNSANLSIEFAHDDHFQPVEIRLNSVVGSPGRVRFAGCELRWIGRID